MHESPQDSPQYQQRKAFFDSLLTIYGRKPVLEALSDDSLRFYKLHLADSNRNEGIVRDILALAQRRGVPIQYHERKALSRISRNSSQDQGVAADIELPRYRPLEALLDGELDPRFALIALDRITNPQNLGMIIRSVGASGIDGLLLPRKGCAALSPLVIKASAGTLFRTPLFYCEDLAQGLHLLQRRGAHICTLSSHAEQSLFDETQTAPTVYVLGNETDGVSPAIARLAQRQLRIPMHNGVESLNVAVTAALIAFRCGAESRRYP